MLSRPCTSRIWEKTSPQAEYDLILDNEDEEASQKHLESNAEFPEELLSPQYWMARRFAFALFGLLGTTIAVLFLLLFVGVFTGPEPKSPVPSFPLHPTRFHRQQNWEYGPKTQALWESVIPNFGLVAIDNPKLYDLGPGLETTAKGSQVFSLVVTHQFHCLKMIRTHFYGLASRNESYLAETRISTENFSEPLSPKVDHIFHCFDYLRQMILCNADTTLEGRAHNAAGHIDGYGPIHQCRNWDDVSSWMLSRLPLDPVYQKPQ